MSAPMIPKPPKRPEAILPEITYCADAYAAAEGADAILIVTEWDEFRQMDWDRLRLAVERPLIVDGRNMLDATQLAHHGFHYVSVGRPSMMPVQSPSTANDVQSLAAVQE